MIDDFEKYKILFPQNKLLVEDINYNYLKNHEITNLLAAMDLISFKTPPKKHGYKNFIKKLKKKIAINHNNKFFTFNLLNDDKCKKENKINNNKDEKNSNKIHIKNIIIKNSKNNIPRIRLMKNINSAIYKINNNKKTYKKNKYSKSVESAHYQRQKLFINCENNKTIKNMNENQRYYNYSNEKKLKRCFSSIIQSYNNKKYYQIVENKSYIRHRNNIRNSSTNTINKKSLLNINPHQQSAKLNSSIEKSIKNLKANCKSIDSYNYKIDYNFFNDTFKNNKYLSSSVHQNHKKFINVKYPKTEKKIRKTLLKKIEDIDLMTNKVNSIKRNNDSGRKQLKKLIDLSNKMDIIKNPENIDNQFKNDVINYQKNIGSFVVFQNIGFYMSHFDCFLDKNNHIK